MGRWRTDTWRWFRTPSRVNQGYGVMNAYLRPCLPLFVLFALAGCDGIQGDGNASQVPSACKMRGNGDGQPTCVTSLSSILASPDRFDGMKVSVGAWVDEVNDVVLLFPTLEAMRLRDSASSLVVYPGRNVGGDRFSPKDLPEDLRFLRVTGVFHWIRDGVGSPHADPVDSTRMGVLERVTIER